MICDINGKVPTFGYPMITFTDKEPELTLYDEKVWRHAVVSNGSAIKYLNDQEFKMVSTAQLK